jgi:6-pyruvoyltetrahydropterin/6-carboxytetrahydropterin synthase
MFKISVETCFRASHQLDLPNGSKEATHSHNWLVTASVSSNKLNAMGVVMDFHRLKETVDKIVAEFDNISLNKTDHFRRNNPSAENVAKYIYKKLKPKLPKELTLRTIKVVEEPGCSAEYTTMD